MDKNAAEKAARDHGFIPTNGVNPMAGCIPVLIQMPILFAVFVTSRLV